MSQILHPFIVESMARFESLSARHCAKVHFIHLNHTNPALNSDSPAAHSIRRAGMQVAEQLATIGL